MSTRKKVDVLMIFLAYFFHGAITRVTGSQNITAFGSDRCGKFLKELFYQGVLKLELKRFRS